MAEADYPYTTGRASTRRAVLKSALSGAGAAAIATALPAAAEAAMPVETGPIASDAELAIRYNAWLHMERRILAMQMYPHLGVDAEDWIPLEAIARRFHLPPERNWQEVPSPSSRAFAVLRAAGVSVAPSGEGPETPSTPLPADWEETIVTLWRQRNRYQERGDRYCKNATAPFEAGDREASERWEELARRSWDRACDIECEIARHLPVTRKGKVVQLSILEAALTQPRGDDAAKKIIARMIWRAGGRESVS